MCNKTSVVVCFLLGDSPVSEFYMLTFRNTLFHLHRQAGACRMNSAGVMFGVLYGKRFGSEMAWAIRTEGDRVGGGSEYRNKLWRVPAYIEADRRMCEGDRVSRGGQGMVEVKLLCFRWLSPFQVLLVLVCCVCSILKWSKILYISRVI